MLLNYSCTFSHGLTIWQTSKSLVIYIYIRDEITWQEVHYIIYRIPTQFLTPAIPLFEEDLSVFLVTSTEGLQQHVLQP